MRFDDLARRAADEVRTRAERGPRSDFAEWRRRRGLRTAVSVVGVGLAAIFAISLGASIGEDDPDLATDTSLAPEVVTTTTIPRTTSTTSPTESVPVGVLGAGWERLDFGPLTGGRYRMATAWTGEYLFVWGGHLLDSQEIPPASEFMQDGYVYDPTTGTWTPTGRPPGLCQLGLARAIPLGGGVLVHGSISIGGGFTCSRAAFYDIDDRAWTDVDNDLFANVSSRSPLADTGEMLVAPGAGLAWNYLTDETFEIPRLPSDVVGESTSTTKAHWTGTEVIVVGSGTNYAWAPGEDAWRAVADPPIPVIARDSVMTDQGVIAVNYQMATAFFEGGEWIRRGDLPLRFYECLPEAVSAGGTPVVRMCSGIAIWDVVADHWVPVPLEELTGVDRGTLVGAGDALYSVGRSLRRFEIMRADDGSIELPPTIPIGVVQLDVPGGWDQVGSIAPDQDPAGFISADETIGVAFQRTGGTTCLVTSTYGEPIRLRDLRALEGIGIYRGGDRPLLGGVAFRDDASGAIVFSFPDHNGSDSVLIECTGPENLLSDAATEFAAGMWSPWEPLESAELDGTRVVVTPQAGPVGTTVTFTVDGFPPTWDEWWFVTGNGVAVAEIPTHTFPHDIPDFTLSIVIGEAPTSLGSVSLDPGTYGFAIDGYRVPGAYFTVTDSPPPVTIRRVFTTSDVSDPIGTIMLENLDLDPIDLSGWTLEDEIVPTSTLTFPDGTMLEARGRVYVEYQRTQCPSPTEADFVVCTDPPLGAVMWDSIALRESHGDLVDRYLVSEPCPWTFQPETPQCGYVLFHDPDLGMRYQVPADVDLPPELGRWHIADDPLTPDLANPREILSLATYPLRQGGDTCAQFPENAFEDLGPLDAIVSIQRRTDGASGAFGPRPEAFTYEWFDAQTGAGGFFDCMDRPDRFELYLRSGSFFEGGDVYFVFIGLGQQAGDTVRAQQVLDILDGLEFDA